MIGLIRKLFWFVLFLVFTAVFVTLFEHGWTSPAKFAADFKKEINAAQELVAKKPERRADPTQSIR